MFEERFVLHIRYVLLDGRLVFDQFVNDFAVQT